MFDRNSGALENRRLGWVEKRFGDLKVRPKLIVLHNLFFLVLTCAAYFSLIPLFENRVASARAREISLIRQMFALEKPPLHPESGAPLKSPGLEIYEYDEGSAEKLRIPAGVREWLYANPGAIWHDPSVSDLMFRKDSSGLYRKVRMPYAFYEEVVHRARITLFVVLGVIYLLAVLLLELDIMPVYVYRPIRLMLNADRATQAGDRGRELIDESLVPGDEIGQIMRSRNATVTELRRQEDELASALRRLEEVAADLQRKNQMLEQQDRLASLGLLSASVAHELNTPLSVLHGSIEKLIETVKDQAAQGRLARMLRVTQRLRKISEGLVDFARVRKQEVEAVELRSLIDEAWALVAIDEKAAEVSFSNQVRAQDAVMGNPDRLVQVFVNLLRNSLVALQSGGTVVVHSRVSEENGRSSLFITVEDDGPGIPEDVLPDIFDAFVSTRLDSRGTGLGLTVAEGIVQQHGGAIRAFNRSEGGASLEVRLPAATSSHRNVPSMP